MAQRDNAKRSRDTADSLRKASLLDKAATKILQSVDSGYIEKKLLDEQDIEFQKIIDRQLDVAKGVAGNQIVDFFATVRSERKGGRPKKNNLGVDTADLFMDNVGDIFSYFQDVYKNRYLEVADLKFISKFIPSLGEAVRIYLDSMVSSDDVSETITRNLITPSITNQTERQQVMERVHRLEEEYNLLPRLKVAYKKTLVSGSFFVYHISYRDLFEMYSHGVAAGKIMKPGSAMFANSRESQASPKNRTPQVTGHATPDNKPNVLGIAQEGCPILITDVSHTALEGFGVEAQSLAQQGAIYQLSYDTPSMNEALESIEAMTALVKKQSIFDDNGNRIPSGKVAAQLRASIEADLPNIYFIDSTIPMELAQGCASIAEEGFNEFFNLRKDVDERLDRVRKDMGVIVDGTFDPSTVNRAGQSFESISGTYLKWIDYKYVIPIDVLGTRVGYFHIITTPKSNKRTNNGRGGNKATEIGGILSSGSMSLFDQMDISEKRKETAIQNIVDSISSAILDQFSTKFVKKYAPFKKLIAECIIANGLVDNDYMIQFIPTENMIEFKCNEDENGKGESILSDAMFPAHLLLSIVICKMLNYINKGGNRTIAHISSGRVNRSLSNQVNRVIRDLQAGNVTFTDLLSSSMVFSKVTRDSNIAMPKDRQGNRLVEFEIQEGQDIDLNTNYETMLERWCMIALGMPPTFMDYMADVNVAKRVVSDNIRVASRTASLQADMEKPTTELYRYLIEDSDFGDDLKTALSNMQFKLPRPRVLANQNTNEALNTAYQNAQTVVNIRVGEDATEPEDMILKRKMTELISRNETPYIDWSQIDKFYEEARIYATEQKVKKETAANMTNGISGVQENPTDELDDLSSI